jgi:hypothetical protein
VTYAKEHREPKQVQGIIDPTCADSIRLGQIKLQLQIQEGIGGSCYDDDRGMPHVASPYNNFIKIINVAD